MSDNNNKKVRRFGRRDQKDQLPKAQNLFPDDDDETSEEIGDPSVSAFDIDTLNLPDTDSEALAMLSTLNDEVRAPIITPAEERYPPIAPEVPRASAPSAIETEPSQQKTSGMNVLYNFLTILLLVGTVTNIVWFAVIWNDPQSVWNPFPPPTPFVEVAVTLAPQNNGQLNATPDESGQIFVVITDTPVPTTVTTESPFPFVSDPVLYAPNSNDLGCNWWSIAGTVTNLEGTALAGYRVRITGDAIDETVFSGASQAFGAGGYELPLIGTPTEAQFTVQLFSPQNAPVSDEISIQTRADCDSNVTILNFVQNR